MRPERWQRIEQIYQEALDKEKSLRDEFLAEACSGDDALRLEVEELLAMYEQQGGFLSAPALELEVKKMAAEKLAAALGIRAGQELSHYKVVSRIGAGGMGEVFLVRDTILERRVALKLLPAHFTENTDRLQRFVREAKAASALNHPNIITIYEIGEVKTALGNTHFIAAEFIEGKTLRAWSVDPEERLRRTVSIVAQVASALDAAHKAGIVHRDIKPENVMVRPDGLVKVLDFGLAKLTTAPTPSVDSEARTMTEVLKTRAGVILGTPRYMSPEQVRGHSVDARSDIFSLGVVLHELLTGQPLFGGDTAADVVAGIIHKEAPPLSDYLSDVPPELERIVQKTLAKDAAQRYQNARDLQLDLQALVQDAEFSARLRRTGSSTRENPPATTSRVLSDPRFSVRQLSLGLGVVLVAVGVVWWLVARLAGPALAPSPSTLTNREVVRWASVPGETYSTGSFSPDGKWVAFTSTKSGSRNIWVRQTVSGEDHQSTKDEFTNESPIWSPQGEELAFFSRMRGGHPGIWRMPLLGGPLTEVRTLHYDEASIRLLRWSRDGSTIYYQLRDQLFALNVRSGEATQLTNLDQSQLRGALSISADGNKIAYITAEPNGHRGVWFMPASGGPAKLIVDTTADTANTVWHPDGERVLYSSSVEGKYQVFVADTKGHQPAQITFGERDSFVVDVSSDGTRVLYGSSEEKSDIWGVTVAKPGEEQVVASDISSEFWPDISPDDKTVVYQAVRNLSQGTGITRGEILRRPIGEKSQLLVLAKEGFLPRWSPEGQRVAFLGQEKESCSLRTVNADGGDERTLVTGGLRVVEHTVLPYNRTEENHFSWSPDGGKLAYCSLKDGVYDLRTISGDGSNDTQITSNRDGNVLVFCPIWSRDGKRIAYATRPMRPATPDDNTRTFWVVELETKITRPVAQLSPENRLLGWTEEEQGLLFARYDGEQQRSRIVRVSINDGVQSQLLELPPANLPTNQYNIRLSPSRRTIAYVAHQQDKENIWITPVAGGVPTKLTANADPQLYFSTLAWSPDSRAIYYGKQSRFSLLSMITSFK